MMRRGLAVQVCGAVAVLALCGAGHAYAHTAQILIQDSTLIYQQFPGISLDRNNDVAISENVDSSGSYYVIDDPESTGMFFPAQCTPLLAEQTIVRCPAGGIVALYVRTGNATKADPTRNSSITMTAPTPATLSGGSVSVNAGTSNVTAGPVGGNVLYGSLGGGTLDSRNGFIDFIHTCPANTVEPDLEDISISDCATIPEPPGTAPSSPPTPSPSPSGSPSPSPSGSGSPGLGSPSPSPSSTTPSALVAVTFSQPQAVLGRRFVLLTVSVAMALTVRVHASIALPDAARSLPLLGRAARLGAPGATVTLRLRLSKRTLTALRHAFARHIRLYANVRIDAASASSSSSFSLARRIRIVP